MAGKKGRSGRPPGAKNKKTTENKPKTEKSGQNNFQTSPQNQPVNVIKNQSDPLSMIEREYDAKFSNVEGQSLNGLPPIQPTVEAPREIISAFWSLFYTAEDAFARKKLGLGNEYAGIFTDAKLIEAHVEPSCRVAVKYLPPDLLNKITQNTPEILLARAIWDSQQMFFKKLAQAQQELKNNTPKTSSDLNGAQTKPPPENTSSYPKKGEV